MLHQRELSGRKTSCLSRCRSQTWWRCMSSVPENPRAKPRRNGALRQPGVCARPGDRADVRSPSTPSLESNWRPVSARKIATAFIEPCPISCAPTACRWGSRAYACEEPTTYFSWRPFCGRTSVPRCPSRCRIRRPVSKSPESDRQPAVFEAMPRCPLRVRSIPCAPVVTA